MLICITHKASVDIQVTNYNYWALSTGRVSVDLYYKDASIGQGELPEGLTIVSRGEDTITVAATPSGDAQDTSKALGYYSKDCLVKTNNWVLTVKITVHAFGRSVSFDVDVDVPCQSDKAIGSGVLKPQEDSDPGSKCLISDVE